MRFLQRNKKSLNTKVFDETDFSVLDYEQLLKLTEPVVVLVEEAVEVLAVVVALLDHLVLLQVPLQTHLQVLLLVEKVIHKQVHLIKILLKILIILLPLKILSIIRKIQPLLINLQELDMNYYLIKKMRYTQKEVVKNTSNQNLKDFLQTKIRLLL